MSIQRFLVVNSMSATGDSELPPVTGNQLNGARLDSLMIEIFFSHSYDPLTMVRPVAETRVRFDSKDAIRAGYGVAGQLLKEDS